MNRKNEISLVAIQPEDNEAIFTIIREILKSHHLDKAGTAYFDPYLSKLYEFYQNEKHGEYWVLKKQDEVIGGIGIGSFRGYEGVAELQKYYIKAEQQGQGFGSLLLDQAISYAKKVGYKQLYIETMDTLDKANKIYEYYGFKPLTAPLDGSEHELMNRWFMLDLQDEPPNTL